MLLNEYQVKAQNTDLHPFVEDLTIPLLGLAGESGELLSEYKKLLRDGDAHALFKERMEEELGDLLWYIASVATKCDLELAHIAEKNLEKCSARWTAAGPRAPLDAGFPEHEQLPKELWVEFETKVVEGMPHRVRISVNGEPFGDELTDNAHSPDGYGYHDVLHFAFASILGWSPLVRKMLKRKRKSVAMIDEVEDGARAIVTEEGVSAIIFAYARDYRFLEGKNSVSAELLKMIRNVVSHLEVGVCTTGEWERAIVQGMAAWRAVFAARGGVIHCDLNARTIQSQVTQ